MWILTDVLEVCKALTVYRSLVSKYQIKTRMLSIVVSILDFIYGLCCC